MNAPASNPELGSASHFPTTVWTQLLDALREDDPKAAQTALVQFCLRYRGAVVKFFRRHGRSPEEAEDLASDFFAQQVHDGWELRKGLLFGLQREKTERFRSFLAAALWRFHYDQWRRDLTQKRGGHLAFVSLDGEMALDREAVPDLPPNFVSEVDRTLALEIILRAAGDSHRSEHLLAHFRGDVSQAEGAERLGISENSFKQAYSRFRGDLRNGLRHEVKKLVGPSESDIEDEIRYLMSLFATSAA